MTVAASKAGSGLRQLLSLFFMMLKASNNLLYLSILTTFLDKAGAKSLPWVYLLVNLLFIVIQFQFMTRIVGREGHWLLSATTWPAVALSLTAAFVFPVDTVPLLIGFLLMAMLIDLLSNQAFTAMLNHFLSIGEARRSLPVIYASGSFGFILSGLLLKFVLDFVGLNGLLFANAVIVALSGIVLHKLKPVEVARLAEVEEVDPPAATVTKTEIQSVDETSMQHPLARLLIISSFLIIFNKYLVDFLFAASLSTFFSSGNDLAAFMGVFGATADFAVIGLQTFVMNRVFSAFPIGRVLAFMPIILTLLCVMASFSLKFAIIAAVQFLVLLNSKNFTVPATTILMGIIPQKNRVSYRRDMSVACSISSAVVGVFLLLARERFGYDLLFLIAATLYLLMAFVHAMLDRAYLTTLRRALVSKDDEFAADQISSLRFLQQQDRIQQLKELLADSNPRIRTRAIEETAELPARMARELLEPLLELEPDSRCLTAITRNLLQVSPEQSAQHIQRLLETTADERLRSDIIETIGKVRVNAIGEEAISPFLDHRHHRVCASAVITTVRLTRSRLALERAMHRLADMAIDTQELMRASAAAVMGELGLPLFIPALANLAGENNTLVATNAASALSRMQCPAAVAVLENLLFHDNNVVARKAEDLLATASRDSVSRISRLLPGITAEERQKLAVKLRSGRHQDSHELLAAILCIDNLEKRRNLINLLEKADKTLLSLMSSCIVSNDQNQIELKIAPLMKIAESSYYSELPPWVPLLTALGGGSVEHLENFPECAVAVESLIRNMWHELAAVVEHDDPVLWRKIWQTRVFACVRIVACLSSEPSTMIKSIKELRSGKSFSRGMAAEYLEARLGHGLAIKILPLVDTSGAVPGEPAELRIFALERGIVFDPDLKEIARLRLTQFVADEGQKI